MRRQMIKFLSDKLMTRDFERRRKAIPYLKHEVKPLLEERVGEGTVGINRVGENCVVGCSQLGFSFDSFDYLAEILEREGISFIGLDYNGLRRTVQDFSRFDISNIEEDVNSVLDYAGREFGKTVLFGSCFGADVAYLSAMRNNLKVDGLIMHAPKAPMYPNELKEFLPKVFAIRHWGWRKVARALRGTDKITLSEATGKNTFLGHMSSVLFEQGDIVKYLNRSPKRKRKDVPIELISGIYDRVVPFQHTRAVYERIRNDYGEDNISLRELEIDHYILSKKPEVLLDSVRRFVDSEKVEGERIGSCQEPPTKVGGVFGS